MLKLHTVCIRNRIVTTDEVHLHRLIIHQFRLCILSKVKDNWTRTTTFGYVKSTCHRPSHILCRTNLITPFRDWLGDTYQIDFLKCIRTQQRGRCLTSNHHNRCAINHGICNTSNRISHTRTTSNQTDPNFTRRTSKTLCGMSGTLFVTDQNMVQLVTMSI